jgi:hypothetical protein
VKVGRYSLTVPVGSTQQSRAYVTSDADRDRYVAQAHAADTVGVLTRLSGTPVSQHRPVSALGSMEGWSGRQSAAAIELRELWQAALPVRDMPAGYADWSRFERRGRNTGCDNPQEAQEAWDGYCKAMDDLARRCSHAHAAAIKAAIVFKDPPTLPRLPGAGRALILG